MLLPLLSVSSRPSCFSRCHRRVCGSAVSNPTIAVATPERWMNSNCRLKMSLWSLSNPTMNPAMTSSPARWSVCTAATRSRFRFWSLWHSSSASTDGVSMPTKTFLNPASTISAHNSGSSARFTDASVRNPMPGRVRRRHSINSRSSAFVRCLLPMKLSSTMKTMSFHPRRTQPVQFGNQLRRRFGAGHAPVHHDDVAKFAIERAAARELHGHGDVIPEMDEVPARHGRVRDVRPVRGAINGLQSSALHVGHDLRHEFLGLAQDEMPDFRERLMAGGEQRPARDDGFLQGRAPGDDFADGFLLHEHRADQHVIRPAQILRP